MSIICLICKDKLLNNAPGTPIGSLNSLVENQVIATGCGHLYHSECLQCWFRTQKKKLQNQGITGTLPDHCPTCQKDVSEEQIRRIHLLEDHREALEKAKFLEKMENLEIYCHQLEINIQRLHRENDMLINKALAPQKSTLGKDDFAAIVKNDRVMWLKKDSPPLCGVVLSIFKKDESLWVKLKLDKKIRVNQRSGLLGSFRFDKKQEWTVPFSEIMLEKDFRKNNIIDENLITSSEPSTPTLFVPLQKVPSFRSSTLSLPGEYLGQNFSAMRVGRVQGMQPILSYDFINNFGSNMELSSPPVGYIRQDSHMAGNVGSLSSLVSMDIPGPNQRLFSKEEQFTPITEDVDQQRDYVIVNPSKSSQSQSPRLGSEGRTSPQDSKSKHVTFADDLGEKPPSSSPKSKRGNHFRDHDYKNVTEMPIHQAISLENIGTDATNEQVHITENENSENNRTELESSLLQDQPQEAVLQDDSSTKTPTINLTEPSTTETPCSPSSFIPGEMQVNVLIDSYDQHSKPNDLDKNFNCSCFDITFTTLFFQCTAFDRLLLLRNSTNDQIQMPVQQILINGFVSPLRNPEIQQYSQGYSNHLYETIAHLSSSYLDLEELMTILFEYVFKIPPFINYSYDMCDYIHQFFIDFTDKEKKPTVQHLLQQSLALQDNLKLRSEPNPALILQMPNSEDGIIHYEAVLPSVSLNITQLLETAADSPKTEGLTCYCNKTATLECATCAQIHGKSPVLFCEDCCVLLEAIHDEMYHKLELSPIKAASVPSICLELSAVICLRADKYSTFLRKPKENGENVNWVFIEDFIDGKPRIEELPQMEEWIESTIADGSDLNINDLSRIQRRLLTECRMFLYVPVHNSFA